MPRTDASATRHSEPASPEDRWLNDEIAELAFALITLPTGDGALSFCVTCAPSTS
jgi:hypothetical protein